MAETDNALHQVLTLGLHDLSDLHPLAFICSYLCGGKTFQILVTDDPPDGYDRESTEVSWTEQLMDLSMHDGTDREKLVAQDLFMQRLENDIKNIALPKMLELAPPSPDLPPPIDPRKGVHTVREHLYPDVIKLQLVSSGGQFELIQDHHTRQPLEELKPATYRELQDLGFEDISSIATVSASEVLLLSRCNDGMGVYYASALGQTEQFVCKMLDDWSRKAFLRELETFGKIRKATRLGLKARLSTLKALVTHKGGICGILVDRIPSRFSKFEDVLNAKVYVPLQLKKTWAGQIESSVHELHSHGIIWGDAKPGNVIIDEHDNVWLIDFNGGYSVGWVEQQLADSIEGDLQAVKKMKAKLESE